MFTKHHRWALTLAAAVVTALLFPTDRDTLVGIAVPTLWALAYVAHTRDALLRRIDAATDQVVEHVDVGVSDTLVAIRNIRPPNQRAHDYGAPTTREKPLRSV